MFFLCGSRSERLKRTSRKNDWMIGVRGLNTAPFYVLSLLEILTLVKISIQRHVIHLYKSISCSSVKLEIYLYESARNILQNDLHHFRRARVIHRAVDCDKNLTSMTSTMFGKQETNLCETKLRNNRMMYFQTNILGCKNFRSFRFT